MDLFTDFHDGPISDAVFLYASFIMSSYVLLAILSALEMRFYMRKNSYVDYRQILVSPQAPSVSILAPAYNEESTIIENVRSLLSLHYNNFEVIIINDGSKDRSLEKLIDFYDLERVNFALHEQIPTKRLRAVYKSKNPAYSRLTVVDKENGGKSDALNMGINVSTKDLILCIDVDCIVEQDAILRMVKPFMDEKKRVIAVGGVVRIANSCEVRDGRLIKVHMPEKLIPRFQVLEYMRAFLVGRMAWSRLNGLLLVSGAMGMFDKEVVIQAGGYNHDTVGEDMELVVRVSRYMQEVKQPYRVVYVPDPLCWTESPAGTEILGRQRNRWTRGTMETLWTHKDLFFNPRYGVLGMISYPYWLFFEWFAPILEFIGVLAFLVLALTGHVTWEHWLILMSFVYAFSVSLSVVAILLEEVSYQQYTSGRDLLRLLLMALIEPLIYHPLTVYWALRGNIDKMTGKKAWGTMTRAGFGTQPVKAPSAC